MFTMATVLDEATTAEIKKIVTSVLREQRDSPAADTESRRLQLTERVIRIEEGQQMIAAQIKDLQHYLDKRFEQVDKRFNTLQWAIGISVGLTTGFMVAILSQVLG